MARFQDNLWGYALSYPDDWTRQSVQDVNAFSPERSAQEMEGPPKESGQILVKAEWNGEQTPIGPLWTRHIGLVAGMLGAKQVGSAPWHLAGAAGMEAEIVLSNKDNHRLWAGILAWDYIVLSFTVDHVLTIRAWFEPLATRLIASLKFLPSTGVSHTTQAGLPLPPGYTPIDPLHIVADIPDPRNWQAYEGSAEIGALQAYYLREAPHAGWTVVERIPFPGKSDLGFARLQLDRDDSSLMLGLMPYGPEPLTASSPACLVIKSNSGLRP